MMESNATLGDLAEPDQLPLEAVAEMDSAGDDLLRVWADGGCRSFEG